MTESIIILFAAAVIGFNIWNAYTLKQLIKRPMRNDALNDKNYWELKYKMQYMATVFSIIIFIAAYLGYSTVRDAKEGVRREFQASLDSSRALMETIEEKQKDIDAKISTTDSKLLEAERAIVGLADREKHITSSLSLRGSDLTKLKDRITEINSKNIIQQAIYIVDNIEYTYESSWEFNKYYFKDLITNSGQPLPAFKKPPFIFSVSNQGVTYAIRKITTESFEMAPESAMDMDVNVLKKYKATLFISENP